MQVLKLGEAKPYDAPGHFGMAALRLQGQPGDERPFNLSLSHFLPGGGAERSASKSDRVYLVISGVVTVSSGDITTLLGPLDSCFIPAGETRGVANETNLPASMVVIVSAPKSG